MDDVYNVRCSNSTRLYKEKIYVYYSLRLHDADNRTSFGILFGMRGTLTPSITVYLPSVHFTYERLELRTASTILQPRISS